MFRLLGSAAVVVSLFVFAACGGSSQPTAVTAKAPEVPEQPSGSLDKAALAEAADVNCGYADELSARLGPRGKTLAGVQAEAAGTVPVLEELQGLQTEFATSGPVTLDWDEYLAASQEVIEGTEAAAEASGEAEAREAFTALDQARQKTYAPADAIGLKVCTFAPAATVVETEMNDPTTFDLAEPSNTLDQAAKAFSDAIESGKCDRIEAQRHSGVDDLTTGTCEYLLNSYTGLDVVGSQSYGPAGMVQFASADDASRQGTAQFVIDTDGKLRYVNESVVAGGGIHPPNEGFDAQQTMDNVLTAIRDEDGEAFAETLGPDGAYTESDDPLTEFSTDPGGEEFTDAVRENQNVDAVMLGANQVLAYFIFDTGDQDYLLEIGHSPGSETEYRNPGFWALPPASE